VVKISSVAELSPLDDFNSMGCPGRYCSTQSECRALHVNSLARPACIA